MPIIDETVIDVGIIQEQRICLEIKCVQIVLTYNNIKVHCLNIFFVRQDLFGSLDVLEAVDD